MTKHLRRLKAISVRESSPPLTLKASLARPQSTPPLGPGL